ncbi:MraY family glycosyltransferase [Dysgonomonas mossii]|uniref:MraY family glycosyltransferase n=2 Tax=Dysgonomonas TaxID=156973 RepID=UPI00208E9D8B|nr:glycosyltransferase family 4 protein [Dysgonomonas mossii]
MIYLACYILSTIFILIYFKVADKYNIVDRPNERSSHKELTMRGGGIIVWFVALFYFLLNIDSSLNFFIGITLIGFVSFIDDIRTLPSRVRAFVQLFSVGVIFYDLNIFSIYPWWVILIAFIISIGIINAYNFMDGINGITGLYSCVVFASFLYTNNCVITFVNNDLLIFPIIACSIFLFFNYRKKAKCFAGDIGSIILAFWIVYILIILICRTSSIVWVMFLSVYGVDSICTILHRLYLKQNIFKPHRIHYYQILSNEQKLDHRLVSMAYAIVQTFTSLVIIYTYVYANQYINIVSIIIIITLISIYSTKFILIKCHHS